MSINEKSSKQACYLYKSSKSKNKLKKQRIFYAKVLKYLNWYKNIVQGTLYKVTLQKNTNR